MTPKERVQAAMDLKPTDKIPLMCQFSIGHMLMQVDISSVELWFDKTAFTNALIKLRKIYDFDGILVSLHGHNPNWRDQIISTKIIEDVKEVELQNGDKINFPNNDLPYYNYKTEKAKLNISEIELSDLPQNLDYIPVSSNLHFKIDENHKFDAITELVNSVGSNYSIHGEVTSPFDYFLDLFGYQDGLMALMIEPAKCELVLSHFSKLISQLSLEMCETGVDAIKISSPFAGAGFISPTDYQKFILPYESEIAKAVREKGVHIYTHTCGSIGDRLESLFDSGISGIECLDPPPLGNVLLENAKERIGNRGFIKGNIDSVHTLLNGSDEDIINDVKNRIRIGSKGSGFILSTACSIAPEVKREKIQLLRKIVDEDI
jgi:Uroporphyrinogen decarboxylase (URO-D)